MEFVSIYVWDHVYGYGGDVVKSFDPTGTDVVMNFKELHDLSSNYNTKLV